MRAQKSVTHLQNIAGEALVFPVKRETERKAARQEVQKGAVEIGQEGSITSTHYKVSEAAAKLDVTEQRVRQMCKERQLQASKISNKWWVDKQTVHDRLPARPPKRRSKDAGALEEQRRVARELAEGNRYLAGELARTREALEILRERYEDTVEKLGERERQLREERRRSEADRKDAEDSAKEVALLEAKVESLKAKLREPAASDKPLGKTSPD